MNKGPANLYCSSIPVQRQRGELADSAAQVG
jgi:hypothetical protein